MKKNLSIGLIVCLAIVCISASAQEKPSYKKVRLGLGLETGLPLGNFGTAYNFGAGASFRLAVALDAKSAITGTVGAMAFMPKSISGVNTKASLNIPVKAGYKYMFAKGLYGLGEMGFTNSRVYFPSSSSGSLSSVSSTKFTYAANIGTQWGALDAALRYEGYSGSGFIGFRLGINF